MHVPVTCMCIHTYSVTYPKSSVVHGSSSVSDTEDTQRGVVLCAPSYAETKPSTTSSDLNVVYLLVITRGREVREGGREGGEGGREGGREVRGR